VKHILRIIDANANRAREGLRVMEDAARFALDDRSLSEQLKGLRHDLQSALRSCPGYPLGLLAARDVEGDVGTTTSTSQERSRADLRDVALAAAGRTSEALRSIEESFKVLGEGGADFESLRYRLYTLEQGLALALSARAAPQWRLCILITESLCRLPWERIAEAALAGGADCLQLREKTLEDRELLARARRLRRLAPPGGPVSVIINDRPDIALLAGADGVHLGQHDLSIEDVRRLAGDRLIIGGSSGDLDEARRVAGADYLGVGPMFATTTKDKPVRGGVAYLREFLASEQFGRLPHLAIGGITPDNVGQLWAAGCRGVAVSAAVCSAPDPASVCRRLLREAPQAGHSQGSDGL
jgi:thiamine-phosphate pyrophosphorylase